MSVMPRSPQPIVPPFGFDTVPVSSKEWVDLHAEGERKPDASPSVSTCGWDGCWLHRKRVTRKLRPMSV